MAPRDHSFGPGHEPVEQLERYWVVSDTEITDTTTVCECGVVVFDRRVKLRPIQRIVLEGSVVVP